MVLIYFQLFSTFKTDKKASIWSQNLINFKFNLTVKIKKTTRILSTILQMETLASSTNPFAQYKQSTQVT